MIVPRRDIDRCRGARLGGFNAASPASAVERIYVQRALHESSPS